MRLEWIEDILAVLEAGSFTAAAERRYLTPSAFTRRIRAIEEALGAALFDRSRKPVTLLPHVGNLEADLRDTARRLRELRLSLSDSQADRARSLSLGCQHALSTMVAPRLARGLEAGRKTELRVRSGTRSECHLMLLRQEVDFGLVYETPEDALQFSTALFDKLTLGTEPLIPVVGSAVAVGLDRRDLPLIGYPADIYLGEVLRVQVLPNLPREVGIHRVAETGLTPAVLQFVRQGLGVGWLPRSIAFEALTLGELTDLSAQLPSATLTVRAVRARAGGSDLARQTWQALSGQVDEIVIEGIDRMATA